MRARVRATFLIDIATTPPALEHAPHPRARTGTPGQVATNEQAVLEARTEAARIAEDIARERFPDAAEVLVEEVTDR